MLFLSLKQLGSSFSEGDLGVLVDPKLNTSQQRALPAKAANSALCCLRCSVERGDLSALLSIGEATPGVLGPVLGVPVRECHGHCEESSMKGRKDDEGSRASFV